MFNMEIKYGEMVVRIFKRVFAPWEFETDYGGFITGRCNVIVTCTDADTDELVGGGNDIDGIKYDVDTLGKHYLPLLDFLYIAINSTNSNMIILKYCNDILTTRGHLFEYVKFID